MYRPTTQCPKCVSDGKEYRGSGQQARCKNCHQFYFSDLPTPDCKPVEINTVFVEEKLTNGGKSHVCNEIAVHNTKPEDQISLCSNCNLPVDSK